MIDHYTTGLLGTDDSACSYLESINIGKIGGVAARLFPNYLQAASVRTCRSASCACLCASFPCVRHLAGRLEGGGYACAESGIGVAAFGQRASLAQRLRALKLALARMRVLSAAATARQWR